MIQTAESSITYVGNNSTVTAYPVPFLFYENNTLRVTVRDEDGIEDIQILGTDFNATGAGNPDGGLVTMTWAVPAVSTVTIFRVVPYTQETAYEEGDAFPAKSHERALDKLTMEVQQLARNGDDPASGLGLAFRLSEASAGINAVSKVNDSLLGVDGFGNAILRTAGETVGWLGQVGTSWADTAARLVTTPTYVGQIGFQRDTETIYFSASSAVGDWEAYFPGVGIVVSDAEGKPSVILQPSGDIVGTTESQVLTNKTLITPSITDPTGLDKFDVGLGNVDNTSDVNKPVSGIQASALAGKQDRVEKGVTGGYASLDGSGKVPLPQIPDALLGASQYQGTWNAATNTPTIPAAALGNKGWYYAVGTAGTTNIDGTNSWAVGDQIISNGTIWQKIVNVSAVSSVNTKTGAVVINKADVGLSNVDNTSDATKDSAATTLTNKTINGANNTLTVRLANDVSGNLPIAHLNGGTGAAGNTWWCGDGSWKAPLGTGDVNGPAVSVDGDFAVYNGTTGKIIKSLARNSVGDVYGPASSVDGELAVFSGTTGKLLGRLSPSVLTPRLPRGHLQGLTISNNVSDLINDIDIAEGECRSSANTADIVLASAITKRLDAAWAVGTNQGGLDTGTIADVTYHVHLIRRNDTGVVDALFSVSPTAPTLPTNYTHFRRIGSIIRKTGAITLFDQLGEIFQLAVSVVDVDTIALGTSQVLYTLPSVPTGLRFLTTLSAMVSNSGGQIAVMLRDPATTDVVPTVTYCNVKSPVSGVTAGGQLQIVTNASAQVAARAGTTNTALRITTFGWIDRRGKND